MEESAMQVTSVAIRIWYALLPYLDFCVLEEGIGQRNMIVASTEIKFTKKE